MSSIRTRRAPWPRPAPTSSSPTWASPPAARSARPRRRASTTCVAAIDADRRRRARRAKRHHRALPWRADRHARRRRLHPQALPHLPRLLRRLEHGAAAGRDRAHRADPEVQGDRVATRCRPASPGDGREEASMAGKFVIASETKPEVLDWGRLGWLSNPPATGREAAHRHRRHPLSRQGAQFPQAPRPGGGDPGHRRQGRAVGRPREAHPRPRRFRLHPGRRRARLVQCRRRPRPRSSRSSGRASATIGYEVVDVAGEAPWKTLRG